MRIRGSVYFAFLSILLLPAFASAQAVLIAGGGVTPPALCDCCAGDRRTFSFETVIPSGTLGTLSNWRCSNWDTGACATDADCDYGTCLGLPVNFCSGNYDLACSGTGTPCTGTCGEVVGSGLPLDLDGGSIYVGGGLAAYPLPFLIPDRVKLYAKVAECDPYNDGLTFGPSNAAEVTSKYCTQGQTCSNDATKHCVLDGDCPGGTCTANCFFGPPLPLVSGTPAMSVCLMNSVDHDISGQGSCRTGVDHLDVSLRGHAYLAGDLLSSTYPPNVTDTQPCPLCVYQCVGGSKATFPCEVDSDCPGSTCDGTYNCMKGADDGSPCVPDTSDSAALGDSHGSYPTSLDCRSDPLLDISTLTGGLALDFSLQSGPLTRDASDILRSGGITATFRTFCGFCQDSSTLCFEGSPSLSCAASAQCDPTDSPLLPTCGYGVPCADDGDCSSPYSYCTQRRYGAFGHAPATKISLLATNDGQCLGDNLSHSTDLVSEFCVGPTFDALVDAEMDLPGPGVIALTAGLQLLPALTTSTTTTTVTTSTTTTTTTTTTTAAPTTTTTTTSTTSTTTTEEPSTTTTEEVTTSTATTTSTTSTQEPTTTTTEEPTTTTTGAPTTTTTLPPCEDLSCQNSVLGGDCACGADSCVEGEWCCAADHYCWSSEVGCLSESCSTTTTTTTSSTTTTTL